MEDINVICQNSCKDKGLNKHQAQKTQAGEEQSTEDWTKKQFSKIGFRFMYIWVFFFIYIFCWLGFFFFFLMIW